MNTLRVVHPPQLRGNLEIPPAGCVLGRRRGDGADTIVSHPTVARRHLRFRIRRNTDLLVVQRLAGPHELSHLNGQRMADEPIPLAPQAVLRFGDVLAVFRGGDGEDPLTEAAASHEPTLLVGEPGSGRGEAARQIHARSGRPGPFVELRGAGLSPMLLKNELFGRTGRLRRAAGGTVLVRSLDRIPWDLQGRLASEDAGLDVRLLATADDPGEVHPSLMGRILPIQPLRARRHEILALIAERPDPPDLSADAAEALLLAGWPDNLAGLDRVAGALRRWSGRTITTADLESHLAPPPPADDPAPPEPPASADELRAALDRLGSVRATARHYGRDRGQVYRWIKRFGLS